MDSRDAVMQIIIDAVNSFNEELPPDARVVVGPETKLFGPDAVLDSLGLVSVIVDVETGVTDSFGRTVRLTDDRAMSQPISPFTDVGTLTSYVVEMLASE